VFDANGYAIKEMLKVKKLYSFANFVL